MAWTIILSARDRFEAMIAAGEFLEWADVFGNLYGTCAADTERMLAAGDDVVLVIDVQGARQVRSRGVVATTIFVMPPSADVLEQRLRGRSKDSEGDIQRRLAGRADRKSPRLPSTISSSSTTTSTPPLSGFDSIVLAERARLNRMTRRRRKHCEDFP